MKVSKVQIYDDNDELTGNIFTVISKEERLLNCIPGNGNPTPTVEWFIGSSQVSQEAQFKFTPENFHHTKQIFCVADNIPNNDDDVVSNKPALYVKGKYGCSFMYKFICPILIICRHNRLVLCAK